ncbi:MAG: hypothetical protein N4A32_06820 [Marinifilaceae bacterium]|jgi:DNA-binding XRE family transcriptional regulator|nr:hypothetical protein [Marinifilaceae bacterium]
MKTIKINELKSIHLWIRESSNLEVFFVSLLIYPLIALVYGEAIKIIELTDYNVVIIICFTICYFLSILIMKIFQTKIEIYKHDLSVILSHSISFNLEYIRFSALENKDNRYSKDYIKKLTLMFPNELIMTKLNQGKDDGIKILKYKERIMSNL